MNNIMNNVVAEFLNSDQCSDEHEQLAKLVWDELSGAAKDTLNALVKAGPLYDGNVPSKSGRDELIIKQLASRAVVKGEQGYQVANNAGWTVLKAGGMVSR